jgi:predicted O-methyltransferase YrrM
MKKLIKSLILKLPYFRSLLEQVKAQGAYPAGHYYSPIPSSEDILYNVDPSKNELTDLTDINMNKEHQYEVLRDFKKFYGEMSFPEKQNQEWRFYFEQSWFSFSDAIFLYCFLRQNQPKRIVEIGSGFSSAVILDTLERYLSEDTQVTLIEPFPDRLMGILRDHDKDRIQIMKMKVQDVPIEILTSLQSGDLLFVDSSHIVKCGSDVKNLIFDILPRLPSGVFVHFHDVFFPFEYPREWLEDGRFWNENYFLRAFLSSNSEWKIFFFNSYVARVFGEYMRQHFPLCVKNTGGSLYLRRK